MSGMPRHHASHMGSPRIEDLEPHGAEASESPMDARNIATLHRGQGVRVTTRKNAVVAAGRARGNAKERYLQRHPEARPSHDGPERSRRNVVLLVLATIAALVALFLLVRCVALAVSPRDDDQAPQQVDQSLSTQPGEDQLSSDEPTEQVDPSGSVFYQGVTYSLSQQDSGRMGLVSSDGAGNDSVLFEIEGTPFALIRSESTLIVPETRDGGWDVVCYVLMGHSNASYLVDGNGQMVTGTGELSSVELDGTVLRITDNTGATTKASLV